MGEGCRTLILSLLNDDTPFGIYTQDRMIAFRFGVEVITVSWRSHVPWKRKSWVPKPHGTCRRFFLLCVFVDSGPSSLEFERVFTTPEWLYYVITPPTSGSPCMTLSFALTHLTTAHHFITGISSIPTEPVSQLAWDSEQKHVRATAYC